MVATRYSVRVFEVFLLQREISGIQKSSGVMYLAPHPKRYAKMKYLTSVLMIMLSFWVSANEDHLVMVPTPIQDEGEIHIVKVPLISGYGANFEGYIHKITDPYLAQYHSPSTKLEKIDLNPASIAGISLKAVLARDNVYDVSIDYTKVMGDGLKDRRLLKSIIKCVYMYGDSLQVYQLKARFKLVGVSSESVLHNELSRCIELRKKSIK